MSEAGVLMGVWFFLLAKGAVLVGLAHGACYGLWVA